LVDKAHQTRRSGRNSRPISAEVALPRLQSEFKVALFLFASHSFLANNLRFMVKLIVKTWFGEPCFKEHSYGKVKGKGVIIFTGHIQCKQSLSPRSLELSGNLQTHR
jgi:hypothetical protein